MASFEVEPTKEEKRKTAAAANAGAVTTYAAQKVISDTQRRDDELKDMRAEFGFQAENRRQWLFVMLDEPDSSVGARISSLCILAFILISCVTFIMETMPDFKHGHCEDVCALQSSQAECDAAAEGLCAWEVHTDGNRSAVDREGECLSFAGRARVFKWNEVDTRTGTPSGGFVLDKLTLALNLDLELSDIYQCSDTPDDLSDSEPTEMDDRVCKGLTDNALIYRGDEVLEGKMKNVCSFRATNEGHMLRLFEYISIAVFTVEYVLRLVTCPQRPSQDRRFWTYVLKPLNLVDLLSIVPFYIELLLNEHTSLAVLRVLRMSRIFRVLKVGNYMHELELFVEGYNRSRDGLVLLLCMLMLYLCVFGSILYLIEYHSQTDACFDDCGHPECYGQYDNNLQGNVVNWDMLIDCDTSTNLEWKVVRDGEGFTEFTSDNVTRDSELLRMQNTTCRECCAGCVARGFTSITTTWYFILATMTTVGYGDHYPITILGKVVTFLCMCFGIIVIALPIIVIGNAFEEVFLQEVRCFPPTRPAAPLHPTHASRAGDT
eukprot:SAG22_NODE_1166_length_5291_cov_4.322227_1_plen_547_part_00